MELPPDTVRNLNEVALPALGIAVVVSLAVAAAGIVRVRRDWRAVKGILGKAEKATASFESGKTE